MWYEKALSLYTLKGIIMNVKQLTQAAIFLAIGTLLHYVVPGIVGGMKPDFLLLMMFLAILLNLDFKAALSVSVLAGIIAAMTTSFPGGQLPSILDKLISGILVYVLGANLAKIGPIKPAGVMVISALGTLVSGFIFTGSAMVIAGLPEGLAFKTMIIAIVIPTAGLTAFFSGVLYSVMDRARKALG